MCTLFSWNCEIVAPQFIMPDIFITSEKFIAQIHLSENQDKMLEIEGNFYNNDEQEIDVHYKLTVIKSGRSSSTSNQSGDCKVNGKSQVILSKSTMNFNRKNHYSIILKVFNNNQLIAEDRAIYYGDNVLHN